MNFEAPKMPTPEELAKRQVAPAEKSKKIVTLPQIDTRDLGVDLTKLGAVDTGGVNDTVAYQANIEKALRPINDLFSNKSRVAKMLEQLDKSLGNGAGHNEDDNLSSSEAMGILAEFLRAVQSGNETAAKAVLKRAATPALQHSIVEARQDITRTSWTGDRDLPDTAYNFFELSESIYLSNHDGKRYETKERADEIEEMKRRSNQLNIS